MHFFTFLRVKNIKFFACGAETFLIFTPLKRLKNAFFHIFKGQKHKNFRLRRGKCFGFYHSKTPKNAFLRPLGGANTYKFSLAARLTLMIFTVYIL